MTDLSIASQTLRNDSDDVVPHPDRSRTAVGVLRVASDSPAPLVEARAETRYMHDVVALICGSLNRNRKVSH